MIYNLEKDLERQAVKHVESLGGICLKVALAYGRGYPDREIILPDGLTVRTEFKRKDGRLSKHQRSWITKLRELGHHATVVDDLEDFKRDILIAQCAHSLKERLDNA